MIDVMAVLEVTLVKFFTEQADIARKDMQLNPSIMIKLGEILV